MFSLKCVGLFPFASSLLNNIALYVSYGGNATAIPPNARARKVENTAAALLTSEYLRARINQKQILRYVIIIKMKANDFLNLFSIVWIISYCGNMNLTIQISPTKKAQNIHRVKVSAAFQTKADEVYPALINL